MPILIIERIKPLDEHDRQKVVRLRARVEGSPEATWKTATLNIAELVADADGSVLAARIAKLKADVLEYHERAAALPDIESRLADAGVQEA